MHQISFRPERLCFIAEQEGRQSGILEYSDTGSGAWNIHHTEVDPEFRGQGVAKLLVEAAAAEAAKQGIRLTASCDYAHKMLAGREG